MGVGLFLLLVLPGNLWFFAGGTLLCLLASVPICTSAEHSLNRRDPGSVVLDEITAVPLCYLTWVTDTWLTTGRCSWSDLFAHDLAWPILGLGFIAFRGFDIAKPWPICAVQDLPRGWGVVVDDLLAALCTAAVILLLTRTL